jgi:AhpD family alkylhydroperoxidase
MKARLDNPAMIVPNAMQALQTLNQAIEAVGVPKRTMELVHLRASQINGCGVCLDMHSQLLKMGGETDERLYTVAAWRDAPYFTDAERAALALTEAVTRLSDRAEAVSDEVWDAAAKHFNKEELGALILSIGVINLWNRVNVSTKQVAGEWMKSREAREWLEKLAAR